MRGIMKRLKAVFNKDKPTNDLAETDSVAEGLHQQGMMLHQPPPPEELIQNRERYEIELMNRFDQFKWYEDLPIAALYRNYEHFVLDQHIELRNEFERFWFHSDWYISDIPNPRDPDMKRHAVLSCIPILLALAFNARIELGLPLDAPAVFTHDQLSEWKKRERVWEVPSPWIPDFPVLQWDQRVCIPHWDNDKRAFVTLTPEGYGSKAEGHCLELGVVVCQPHNHFI